MDDASSNPIGVTKRGTIWCSLDNVGATSPFKGDGSLLEVQAGVSEKDSILVGEVTGGMSFVWGEVKPSQNRLNLPITNANGLAGNEFSCPPSNPDSDTMVPTDGDQLQKRIWDEITC